MTGKVSCQIRTKSGDVRRLSEVLVYIVHLPALFRFHEFVSIPGNRLLCGVRIGKGSAESQSRKVLGEILQRDQTLGLHAPHNAGTRHYQGDAHRLLMPSVFSRPAVVTGIDDDCALFFRRRFLCSST